MSEPTDREKFYQNAHAKEIELHWKRNGFFLLTSSILLLALSRFQDTTLSLAFGMLGITLNIIWVFIQIRSNGYVREYKKEIPKMFDKPIEGIEMRKLAILLPFPFIMIWTIILIQNLLK
ncbi:MAG: hypothetical protein QXE82_00180 [Candidatus Nitrosotenuis sp.]